MIDIPLIIAAGASWWLGVCSMALWQNRKHRLTAPIPAELQPQQLVEKVDRPNEARLPPVINSPFAPKPRQRRAPPMGATKAPPSARLTKLRHWPMAIPEKEKPPAMIEARPRRSPPPPAMEVAMPAAVAQLRSRSLIPQIEFGSGAKP